MATPTTDREAILRTIQTWPVEDQVAFAQVILRCATGQLTRVQQPSWRQLAGLASTEQPPPSDEDVARWLDEHRSEKYG